MFEKTEKDVQQALNDYNIAIAKEEAAEERRNLRETLDNMDPNDFTEEYREMFKIKLKSFEKSFKKRGDERRAAKKEYFERLKARDADILAANNEIIEKKENQIYFDGHTYTTRWSCLPA